MSKLNHPPVGVVWNKLSSKRRNNMPKARSERSQKLRFNGICFVIGASNNVNVGIANTNNIESAGDKKLKFIPKDNLVALHFKYDQARRRFVEWAQNEIAVVPDFHKRILFSDEAHFWLNGYVNKQSCRIWSEANPQVYVETPLHPEKLTVWCTLWAGGILLQKR
ncbi:hypothetical protein TNCV_3368321 [Trichonephila clavipes]|nr:hypothetical protein TNCV_3368321 [Trichonephila clavipes]